MARAEHVDGEPRLPLTDRPVADQAGVLPAFRMYRTHWAVEHCFKSTEAVLGREDGRLPDLDAILRDELARHGAWPPRLAALLGSAAPIR